MSNNTFNKRTGSGTFDGFGFELEYTNLSGKWFDPESPKVWTGEILYMPDGLWYLENGIPPRPDNKWKESVKAFVEETA